MKTIDFKTYEKLKIRPVNVNNIDDVGKKFRKSDLKTFDVARINNMYYMLFINNELEPYDNKPARSLHINRDVFIKCYESIFTKTKIGAYGFLYFDNYDELMKSTDHAHAWDVADVFVCPKESADFFISHKPFRILDLTNEYTENLMKNYKYRKYILK